MTTSAVAAACFLLALLLRLVPAVVNRGESGVDHWYWRAFTEAARRQKAFPPDLPQYRLDVAQWYPPLFPRLLVLFGRVLERPAPAVLVPVLIDIARMSLIVFAADRLGLRDPSSAGTALLLYALTPVLVAYNIQLNPRGLGALFLDSLFLLLLLSDGPAAIVGAVVLVALIALTHKMTFQLYVFLAAWFALAGDGRALLALPLGLLAAWIASGGYYAKVLRAHAEILGFWRRQWPWLMADPLLESPIYGTPGYETPSKAHRSGAAGIFHHLRRLVRYHPAAWIAMALLAAVPAPLGLVENWLIATIFFALLTQVAPPFKFLGMGDLYMFNAAMPAALLFGLKSAEGGPWRLGAVAGGLLGFAAILAFYRLARHRSLASDPDFAALLSDLAARPRGAVLCLPPAWYDYVAYRTGQPVLFGGHGYGFTKLEPFFPVIRIPFREMAERHDLSYVATDGARGDAVERILRDEKLIDGPPGSFGPYRLFAIRRPAAAGGTP